jgi:hypothetical protein
MIFDNSVTMASLADRVHRLLRREYRRLSTFARLTRAAFALSVRTVRPVLPAGFASRKGFLVLPSAIYAPGLFSAFATVLGLLEHYDNWRGRYAGVRVDFGNEGLYYDPSAGDNWWEYFFERIDRGAEQNAPRTIIGTDEQFYFARRVERTMPRAHGFALIDQYIRPQQHIREKVDAYVRANFDGAFMIGIHYRGTDKFKDAPRVPYERVQTAVLDAIKTAGPTPYKLFVATDEEAFLDYMLDLFPGKVDYLDMYRSVDGKPIDVIQGDNRKKGEDAVMDCLLLSRCDYLVRTASNLSLCSTFFNPDMPVALLNRER